MNTLSTLLTHANNQIEPLGQLKLDIRCDEVETSIFTMPIEHHKNHKQTMFGGSISMAITGAAWLHVAKQCPITGAILPELLVRRQVIDFLKPITSDAHITVETVKQRAHSPTQRAWDVCVTIRDEKNKCCALGELEYRLLDGS